MFLQTFMNSELYIIYSMKVGDFINSVVITTNPEASLSEVIDILAHDKTGRVVVMKEENPIGMISTRDVVAAFSEHGLSVFNLKAKDVMSEELIKVSITDDVNYVVRIMAVNGIGGVPVMDGNVLSGIFTEREVLKLLHSMKFSGLVDSVMSTKVVTIDEESTIVDAAKLMARHNIRRLPVVKNDKLVGIITAADIVKFLNKVKNVGKTLDAGTRNPLTIHRYETISNAVSIMLNRNIGTLPVVENDKIVGIVTERDLMYAYVTLT